jgi:uncharacterized SAM-binding protein YcdF (DUF218 family)
MVYIFSKLFWFVIQLGNLLVLVLAVAVAALFLGGRRARGFIAAVTLAFVAIAVLPLGSWAIAPLEARFPEPTLPSHIAGIILLGGAIRLGVTQAHDQVALNEHAERITMTLALARRFPDAVVVVTGGDGQIIPSQLTEAEAMRRLLVADGLDEHRLRLEGRSRNTFENAVYSKALIEPKPGQVWLLVTSAFHMPRAVGCFRHVGWAVLPYPVDYETNAPLQLVNFGFGQDLRTLDDAWHEWLGLVAYRLLGRIDVLFPAPAPSPS